MSQIADIFVLLLGLHLMLALAASVVAQALVRSALADRRVAVPLRVRNDRPCVVPSANKHAFAPAIVVTRYPTRGPPVPQSPQRLVLPDRLPRNLSRLSR